MKWQFIEKQTFCIAISELLQLLYIPLLKDILKSRFEKQNMYYTSLND